jgi:UDP-N-acetylmuramate--alanine ligase
LDQESDFFATKLDYKDDGSVCFNANIRYDNKIEEIDGIQLKIPGEHNVKNALAVIGAIQISGIPLSKCVEPLEAFIGTGRRFDIIGTANGITIIDDYAHHPTEISATLSAARLRFPGHTLWAVWQPHTYSRTRTLLDAFTKAFIDCDHLIVTEIYRSREKPQDYSASEVVRQINHSDVHFIPDFTSASDYLTSKMQKGDVLLVLSAGDADQISARVLQNLNAKPMIRSNHG